MAEAAPQRSGAGRALRAEKRDPFCEDVSSVSQAPQPQLPARINLIHRKTLRVVEEELLVSAAGQKLWQFRGIPGGNYEDVGIIGDAVRVVVDHVLVAIERETVVKIAAEVLDSDDLDGGVGLLNLVGERTRGVGEIEQVAVHAEQEEHESDERNERDGAEPAHSIETHDNDDEQCGEDAEDRSDDKGTRRRNDALVDHVLRTEQHDEGHEAGESGVEIEQPVGEAVAPRPEEVVADEDGKRRQSRKNVTG